MKRRLQCLGCKSFLAYDTVAHDRGGICPECGILLLPPADDAEGDLKLAKKRDSDAITECPDPNRHTPGDADLLREVLAPESKIEDLLRESRSLAQSREIRLGEVFQSDFSSKGELDSRLLDMKRDFPETTSAYVPSGKISVAAFAAMLGGTLVAAFAGALAELVVGVVVIFAAPFVGGWTCARVIMKFGRWQKNRSPRIAALLSVVAAALTNIVIWLGVFSGNERFGDSTSQIWWIVDGLMALGALIAIITARIMAAEESVNAAKFCENCKEFMDKTDLKHVTAGRLQGMVCALGEQKPAVAAAFLCGGNRKDGKVLLFECPCCHSGYVELQVDFKAHYAMASGLEDTQKELWLVGSKKLSAGDLAWFRLFKGESVRFQSPDKV